MKEKSIVTLTPGQAVAVDARHRRHDDGGGTRSRRAHGETDEAVVVVDPATVHPVVVVQFGVLPFDVSEVSATSYSDENERENRQTIL